MNRYRYIKCKCPIVQHIHSKEQRSADAPFTKGYRRTLDEKPAIGIELVVQSGETSEYELEICDKKTAVWLMSIQVRYRFNELIRKGPTSLWLLSSKPVFLLTLRRSKK